MKLIRKRCYARAGLLGNPSDGYNGKTLSVLIRDFWSEVVLYEWDAVEIVQTETDRAQFRSIYELAHDVQLHGYYGGIRLVKATIKRFVDYCISKGLALHERNFSIRYESNIPRQVGLAGSSSIIIATLRCLMAYYDVTIPIEVQPSLALSVEMEELGISAGLQDRIIQCYEGIVYMDFDKQRECSIDGFRTYDYEQLEITPPPLYLAYHTDMSEPTELFHNDIRGRYQRGDPEVKQAMQNFAALASKGRAALQEGDIQALSKLIDANFDYRRSLYQLPEWQTLMIDMARTCGASAKFAGSGGAIIGTYSGDAMYQSLHSELGKIGSQVIKPLIHAAP